MNLIVAVCKKNGIGKEGNIPWYIKEDLKYFKDVTSFINHQPGKNVVIMGRKTWDSIGKPLPGRANIVLTNSISWRAAGAIVVNSFKDAINYKKQIHNAHQMLKSINGYMGKNLEWFYTKKVFK